jgi:hypothetical protein
MKARKGREKELLPNLLNIPPKIMPNQNLLKMWLKSRAHIKRGSPRGKRRYLSSS